MHTFSCIDAHTCGNPVRVVTSGIPDLEGENMFERRQHFLREFDWIRKALMFEPRGHDMMSGSMLYPAVDDNNDVGVLFIETSGCLPMCGHGLIGTVTVAIEHGMVQPKVSGILSIETPAGLVKVKYKQRNNKVLSVRFENVPSYLALENAVFHSSDLGELHFDVGYGGNFYAIVEIQENFIGIQEHSALELIQFSRQARDAINRKYELIHPLNHDIRGVSHVLWGGIPQKADSTAANAVFYGEKAIDRSPCGTGTSARMAQQFIKGKLKKGQRFVHESIIGSQFVGEVVEETKIAGKKAIIPAIEGWAKVIGKNTIYVDENDPFPEGFQVI